MRHNIFLAGFLFVCVLMGCNTASGPTTAREVATLTVNPPAQTPTISSSTSTSAPVLLTKTPASFRDVGTVQRGVVYCTSDGGSVAMDIFFPAKPKREPAPLLVFLHGAPGIKEEIGHADQTVFLSRGYVIAAPNWRQLKDGYPAQVGLADAKCAVRYLRAHANVYRIDPERIGAWGCSAGGWAASMLGVTDASAGLEGSGEYQEQSSRVNAVVTYDGWADTRTFLSESENRNRALEFFGVASLEDPLLSRLSPATHLSNDDPPFLIFASEADGFMKQAEELNAGLKTAGTSALLTPVKNADHCGSGDPTEAERLETAADFFEQTLK